MLMFLLSLQQQEKQLKKQQQHHHHQDHHSRSHRHRVRCCRSCSTHRMQAHTSRWAHPLGLRVVLLHVLLLGTLLPLPSNATLPPDRSAVSIVILQHELRLHAHGGGDLSVKWALSSDITGERARGCAYVYPDMSQF